MIENPIIKRIEEAKNKFLIPGDQAVIDSWMSGAKKSLFVASLRGNKGIELILETFTNDIRDINLLLVETDSSKLSDKERDRLLDRRNMYRKFVLIFRDGEKNLEAIEKQIDELV
jgi:hypothetical protein